MTAVAGDINERSQQKIATHRKRKARRQARNEGQVPGNDGADEEQQNDSDRAVEKMRDNVAEMTADLEQRIRQVVDAKVAVDNVATVLRELDANLSSNGQGMIAPTQSTLGASQLRDIRRRRPNVDLSDADEDENEDASRGGLLGKFKQKVDNFHSEYENLSMRHR